MLHEDNEKNLGIIGPVPEGEGTMDAKFIRLERAQSARLAGPLHAESVPGMPVTAPVRVSSSRRSPLVRSRLAGDRVASHEITRSSSSSPHKSKASLPSLTPNSKRAVSRLAPRQVMRTSESPSFTLDLEGVKPVEPACYSPLRQSQSPSFSPRQVQCVGNYDLGKTIGRGRFGKVKLATHVLTGQQVAVKIVRKKCLSAEEASLLRREVDILKSFNHPNIIKLYEVLETEKVLFLIMEHASGGEVLDFIVAHKKLPEPRAKQLFRQMVSALAHIHSMMVAHRDLKAENILLDSHLNIKIIDFGLSNFFTTSQLLKTPCGSPSYAAPELIRKVEYDGPAADIWSLGVNLYVLVCGVLPFKPTDLVNLYDKVLKGEYEVPGFMSAECADLISKMLVVDPKKRLTITEIMEHPWVHDPTAAPIIVAVGEEEVVDPAIIREMVRVGFEEDIARQSVKRNSCNPASATFSILMDRKRKRESLQSHKMVHRAQSEDLRPDDGGITAALFSKARTRPIVRNAHQGGMQTLGVERTHKRTKSDDGKGGLTPSDTSANVAKESSLPPDLSLPCVELADPFPSPPSKPAPMPPPASAAHRRLMRNSGHRRCHSVDVKHSEKPEQTPATTPIFNKMFEDQEQRDVHRGTVSVPAAMSQLPCRERPAGPSPSDPHHVNRSLTERSARPKTLTEEEAEEWRRAAEQEQRELADHLNALEVDDGSKKAFKMILSYTKRLLNKRAADEQQPVEPRQARVAFPNTMSTSMEPSEIIPILEAKLSALGMQFMRQEAFCLKVVSVSMNVQFEVEVCRMPRLTDMYCIRTKRVAGDWECYRSICGRLHAAVETAVA